MIKIPATTLFKKEGGVYDQAAAISIKIPATTLFKKEGGVYDQAAAIIWAIIGGSGMDPFNSEGYNNLAARKLKEYIALWLES
jgi:hypothetical protein